MPALAAPGSNDRLRPSFRWPALRFRRPVAIMAAVAALALGGGMSAARLWQAIARTGTPPAATVAQSNNVPPPTRLAQVATPVDAAPINAAPARPSSVSDLDVTGEPRSGMASVDPRELLRQVSQPAGSGRVVSTPVIQEAASDEARAIASPIHAPHHEPVQAAQGTMPTPAPQAVAPVQKPQPVAQSAPVERPQADAPSPAPAQATHHLHRVVARASATNVAKADPPTQAAQDKPAAPAKPGDVQLF
jgi:hypothetical protein